MSFIYLTDNVISSSSVTFSGTSDDSNYPHENIANGRPWEIARMSCASTGCHVHAALTSNVDVDFCSIHFHNIATSITVKLCRGTTGGTDVVTMTRDDPTFYSYLTSTISDDDWRIKIIGTTTSPIYIGEWVLGTVNVITRNPNFGWSMEYERPQQRVMGRSGVTLVHNLSKQRLRRAKLKFLSLSSSQVNEHLDMLENCSWGEDPLVIVPDTSRNWVIHGRPSPSINMTVQAAQTEYWRHEIEVVEDPGPIIVK